MRLPQEVQLRPGGQQDNKKEAKRMRAGKTRSRNCAQASVFFSDKTGPPRGERPGG